MRNATTPVAPQPPNPVLHDFGALYPLAAYWSVDEPMPGEEEAPSGTDGGLDEEVLNEAIFAGMVALR